MPRNKPKKIDFTKLTFVLDNLTDEQLDEMDSHDDYDAFAFIDTCAANGLDIKFSWDHYSDCFQVTGVCMLLGYENMTGFGVSGRSTDGADDALKIVWYKVSVLSDWNLSQWADKKPKNRRVRG